MSDCDLEDETEDVPIVMHLQNLGSDAQDVPLPPLDHWVLRHSTHVPET
jgi:hypothetical protein